MIIDRYTKFVFTLIAISLFVISLNPWIAPTKAYAEWGAHAQERLMARLELIASSIEGIDYRR